MAQISQGVLLPIINLAGFLTTPGHVIALRLRAHPCNSCTVAPALMLRSSLFQSNSFGVFFKCFQKYTGGNLFKIILKRA
ncbi:hypothetical protein QUF75_03090 [Desulfococcaceae bacterium HSG7]|nr:hypothetical protein [Desulfococcaceae bacterium HSG7]